MGGHNTTIRPVPLLSLVIAALPTPILAAPPQGSQTSSVSAQADFEAGHAAQAVEHDFPKAIRLLSSAVASNPGFAVAYADRGMTYFQMRQYAKAANDFQTAMKLGLPAPMQYVVGSQLGITYRALNKPELAIDFYSRLLEQVPGDWNLLMQRGEAYQLARKYDLAARDYAAGLVASPDNPQIVSRNMVMLSAAKRWGDALAACDQLLGLRPEDPDALTLRPILVDRGAGMPPTPPSNATSPGAVPSAMSRFRHGDVSGDVTRLRYDFAAHDPTKGTPWELGPQAEGLLQAGAFKDALKLADDRLAYNFFDLSAHITEVRALRGLGRPVEAQRHLDMISAIFKSILGSGDGTGKANAYSVISIAEEYAVLGLKQLTLTSQEFVLDGARKFDKMTTKDATGKEQILWFDINHVASPA